MDASEPPGGVKFFCNADMFRTVKLRGNAEGTIWRAVKKNWGIWWQRKNNELFCQYGHALTITWGSLQEPSGDANILLCPWFVDTIKRQRDPHPNTVLGWIGDRIVRGVQHTPVMYGRKVIDLYAWHYTTILHEVSGWLWPIVVAFGNAQFLTVLI